MGVDFDQWQQVSALMTFPNHVYGLITMFEVQLRITEIEAKVGIDGRTIKLRDYWTYKVIGEGDERSVLMAYKKQCRCSDDLQGLLEELVFDDVENRELADKQFTQMIGNTGRMRDEMIREWRITHELK